MQRKDKILIGIVVLLSLLSISALGYRVFVLEDYDIFTNEEDINPLRLKL